MLKLDLYNGDCLEIMDRLIADGVTVDAIITDPPYGTVKGANLDGWKGKATDWDTIIPFNELNIRFNKLLKEKGALILFGQEPYSSSLIQNADKNIPFSYRCIWLKDHFANPLASKKAPVNYIEDINIFFKKYDIYNQNPLRQYFKQIMDFIGLNLKQINSILGHRKAEHSFYIESTQFKLCSENVYDELILRFNIDKMNDFKSYSVLKQINFKFEPTFNLEGLSKKSNVLKFKKEYKTVHPTQKPVALMEYLIKTYTNENETVLDFTMGSFTTAIACLNTKRNFIGIELDEHYFEVGSKRVNEHLKTLDYAPKIRYFQEIVKK